MGMISSIWIYGLISAWCLEEAFSQGDSKCPLQCNANADCMSNNGTYTCVCKSGYKGDGYFCKEINYCKKSPCINGECRSTPRGFECLCEPGWEGATCNKDVDECQAGLSRCHPKATCLNTYGSYACVCTAGYKGDGFTCLEINYCKASPCINGHCRSHSRGFQCLCGPGWEGITCDQDVNECNSGLNMCHSEATCVNTAGSYKCYCNTGYRGDGFTCTEINLCKKSPCKNGHCRNDVNQFKCICNPGWKGATCSEETQSTLLRTTSSAVGQIASHIMNGSSATSIQINENTSRANQKVSELGTVIKSTTAHKLQSTGQLSNTEARLIKSSQKIPGNSATNADYYSSTVTYFPSVTPAIQSSSPFQTLGSTINTEGTSYVFKGDLTSDRDVSSTYMTSDNQTHITINKASATGYNNNESKPETTHLSTLYLETSNASTQNRHSSNLVTRILHDITSSGVTSLLSSVSAIKGTDSETSNLGLSTNTLVTTLANITSSEAPSDAIGSSRETTTINRTTGFERDSTTSSKISITETSDSKTSSQNMSTYEGEGTDTTSKTLRPSMFSSQELTLQQASTESIVVSDVTSLKPEFEVYISTISPSGQNIISSNISPVFLTTENNIGASTSINTLKNSTLSENVTPSSTFNTSFKASDLVTSEFIASTSKSENITYTAASEMLYHTTSEISKMKTTSLSETTSTSYLFDTYTTQEKSSSTVQTSSPVSGSQAMMASPEQYTFSAFNRSLNTLSENLITTVMQIKTPTEGIDRSYHSVVHTYANKVTAVSSEETTASPQVVSEVPLASPADSTDTSVSSNKITYQTLRNTPQALRTGQSTDKGQNAALTSSSPISTYKISVTSVKPEASSILIDRRISANMVLITKGTGSGSIITETSSSNPYATLSPSDMDTSTTSGNNIVSLPILISDSTLNTPSPSVSGSRVSERFSKASNLNLIPTNENTDMETSSIIKASEPLYSWSNSDIHSTAQEAHALSIPVTKISINVTSQPPEANAIPSDTTKSPIAGESTSTNRSIASMRSTSVTQNINLVVSEFSKPTNNLKPETAENLQSHSTFRPITFGKDNFAILHAEIMSSSFTSLLDHYIQHSTSTNPNRISGVDTSTPLESNTITVYALNARSGVTSNPHNNLKISTIQKEFNKESTTTHSEDDRSTAPITRATISAVSTTTSTLPNHFTYGKLGSVTSATIKTDTNTNFTTTNYENSNTLVTSATSYNTASGSLSTQTRSKNLSSTIEDDHGPTTKSDVQSTYSGEHQTASPMYSTTNNSEISTHISFTSSSRTTPLTSSSLAEIKTSSITRSSSLPFLSQVITALSNSAQENTSRSNISYSLTSDFENQTTNGIKYTQLYLPGLMTESRSATSRSEIISSAFTGNFYVSSIPSTYPQGQAVDTGTSLSDVTTKVAMTYVTNKVQDKSWVTSREMKTTGHTTLNMLATKHASNTSDTSHMTTNSHNIDTSQSQFTLTTLNSTSLTGTYPDEETNSKETMSRSINSTYIRNVTSSSEASRKNPYSTNQEAQSVTQSGEKTSTRLDVMYSGTKSEIPNFTYSRETVSQMPYVTYSDVITHKIKNNTESTEERRQLQDFTRMIHTINTGETTNSMDDMRHSKETSAVQVFTFTEKVLNKNLNVTHFMKVFSNADVTHSEVTQLQTAVNRKHNITQFENISSTSPVVSDGEILHTSPNVTYLELVSARPYTFYPDKKTSSRTDISYSEVTRNNIVGTNSEERTDRAATQVGETRSSTAEVTSSKQSKDSSTIDKEMTSTHGQIPDFTSTENSTYKWTSNLLSRKTSKKSHTSYSDETGKILNVTYPKTSMSKTPAAAYSEETMTIRPSFIHSDKAIGTSTYIPDFEETTIEQTDVPKEKSSMPDVPVLKETTSHLQVTSGIRGYVTQSEKGSNKTPQITSLRVSVNINPDSTYSAGTTRSPDVIYSEIAREKPLTTQSEDTSRHLDLTKQDDKGTTRTDFTLLQETSRHIDGLQSKETESRPAHVTGEYIDTNREITKSKGSEYMYSEGITNAKRDVTYSENTMSEMTDLTYSGGRTSKSIDHFFSLGKPFKRSEAPNSGETSAWIQHANTTNLQKTTKMPNLTQFQITSEMQDDTQSEETSRSNKDVTTVLVSTMSEAKFLVKTTTNRTNSTYADETTNTQEGTNLAGTSRPVEAINESTTVPNFISRPNVTILGEINSMLNDTPLRDTSRDQQAEQLQATRVMSKVGTQLGITSNKTSRLPNTEVSFNANPVTTFSSWTTGGRLNATFSEETSTWSDNVKNPEISERVKSDGIYSRDITSEVPDFTYSDNTMSKTQDVTYSEKRLPSRQDNLFSVGTTLKGQDLTGREIKDVTNLEEGSKIPKVTQLQETASVRKDTTEPDGSTRNQVTTTEIMSTFTGITLISSEDMTYSEETNKSPGVTYSKETINYSEGATRVKAGSDETHQSAQIPPITYTSSEYSNIAATEEASTSPGTTNLEKRAMKGLHTTQFWETTTRMPQIIPLQTASKRQKVTQSENLSSKSPQVTDLNASKSTLQGIIQSKVTIRKVTESTAISTRSDETARNGQEVEEEEEEASTISGETSNISLSESMYVTNSTVTISSHGTFSEERSQPQDNTNLEEITHNIPSVTQSEEDITGESNITPSKTSPVTLPNVKYSVGAINKRQNVTYTNETSSQPPVTYLTENTRRNNETNLGFNGSPNITSTPLKFVTSQESHVSIHFNTTLIPQPNSKQTQPSITDSVITSNKMSSSSSVHTEKSTQTTNYVNKTTSLPTLASIEKDITSSVDSRGSSTFNKVFSDLHPSTASHSAFQTSKPLQTVSVSTMEKTSLSNYSSLHVYPVATPETSNVSHEILSTPQHSSTYNEISTKTWTEDNISVSTPTEDIESTVSTHNTIYTNHNSSSYGMAPRRITLNSAPVSTTNGTAVPLFAYGESAGDITYVLRKIDFNSPLFQPVMGFPFGNQLRSFLYYTDNGQIIFPPSKSSIFSYPNPPANGFTADYNVATIAVFWEDADFSKNVGTTYYKEYIKCSSGNESFITEVEEMIRRYMNTSYTAQWTLKITWEKAPAYPAKDDDTQTNTYQAVLTTDGFVSYILMLYKDGGMNWDVSIHHSEVVIGYSSGISNNFFKNDDIMRRPAYEKYRPSNYVGYNSDMTGLWIYTLNSNAVNNSRMKCLNWYVTQPPASQWNSSLLSCPCLYRQGCADFRYRTTNAAQSLAVRMLRPTFPNNFGAGIRCLYNLKNNFLEGFQERMWTFAPIVPDEEILAQEWCCDEVDDPQFCEMYREKRPSVNCWDYKPLSSGWMFGHSHITTLDGLNYTFNGLGDFTLLNASDTGISVILQGRTVQNGTAMAANFQAFAIEYISNSTNVKMEWYLSKDNINTYINGHAVNFSYSADMNAQINNSNPGVFILNDGSITATFEGLLSVSVSAYARILNAIVILPSQLLNKTQGLLGVWNWYMSDDLMRPDGSYISIKSAEEDIYNYGKSWEVTEDSLFTINQSRPIPSHFTPVFFNELISTNMGKYLEVSTVCADNKECIYDALSAGNETMGLLALRIFNDFQSLNITLNLMPPKIIGASNIQAFFMESVQKLYIAHGAGATFTAYTSMQLNVTETGLVTWTPSSTYDFTFQLEAIDSYNLSSIFFIKFIVCSCRVSSECDYQQITQINRSSLYVASCNCIDNYTGIFCQQHINPCTQGCYINVSCDPLKGCGPCPEGLSGDGLHCSDFDECSQTPCSPNAVCTNTLKGYNCTCKQGFTGNGTHCEDLNKCLTNPCSPYASCTNTKSGYLCSCNKGFLGNGYECTLSCGPCDPDYCGNGQPCSRVGSTCAQKCSCHPMFTDDRCLEAGNSYSPEAAENTPQRTIHLRMSSRVNITAEEANRTVAEFMRLLPVNRFVNISNFRIYPYVNSMYRISLTSMFSYNGNISIITFLNEQLISAVRHLIYSDSPNVLRTAVIGNITFERVRNGQYYTVDQLEPYFTCSLYGYLLYTLNKESFTCESQCKTTCQNNATCVHMKDEIICRCNNFSIYSTSGAHCENLSMNLNAFFGILFGSLAFLFLLLLGIGLCVCYCQKRYYQEKDAESYINENIFQKKPTILPFKIRRPTIPAVVVAPEEPSLVNWSPYVDNELSGIYRIHSFPR